MGVVEILGTSLAESISKYGVPGASLAVLADGELHQVAAGVLNTATHLEATTDSVFQIGSITKLMTSVMAMQLVEEGKLDIDAPVRDVLLDFAVGDPDVSAAVTPRHLLNHSSGIDGDFFVEAGRGDDMIERLLRMGKDLPQLHPLGEGFSYCNFGFAVVGRIIEVLDGAEWDASLHRRIARRLETEFLHTRPEEILRRRAAIGHVLGPESAGPVPVRRPFLPFAMGPAGTTPMCRARDLVDFARSFLAGGAPLVTPSTAAEMLTANTRTVNSGSLRDFGIGFMLFDWGDGSVFGHDGATVGQNSFLRIHESGTVVALLTNGGDVQGLAHEVMTNVFTELAGIAPPTSAEGESRRIDTSRYVGVYRRGLTTVIVEDVGGELRLTTGPGDDWSKGLVPPTGPFVLRSVDDDTFAYRVPGASLPLSVKFIDPDGSGGYRALHMGLRRHLRDTPTAR